MKTHSLQRRDFLRQSLALAAGAAAVRVAPHAAWAAASAPGQPSGQSVRLGGPAFAKTQDPDELALAHRALGYRAAFCPTVPLQDADRIRAFREAFARHDVVIAEVGRWCNLLDADADKRRQNLQTVTDGLALAEAIGARCCVDIAGSFSPTSWFGPHPDNLSPKFFDAAVENARKIIDAVKPTRARFCYEMMGWALPDSPASCAQLVQAVDRPAFGVHLDPCNLINAPAKFYRSTELLNECFDRPRAPL
jgi:sugar phosphate isomerase/epimerase